MRKDRGLMNLGLSRTLWGKEEGKKAERTNSDFFTILPRIGLVMP